MTNFIVLSAVALLLFLAGRYLYREKKKGRTCVGCPYAQACAQSRSTGCSCNQEK